MLTEVGPGGRGAGTDFDLGRADEHNVVFASVISRDRRDAVVIGAGVRGEVGRAGGRGFTLALICSYTYTSEVTSL